MAGDVAPGRRNRGGRRTAAGRGNRRHRGVASRAGARSGGDRRQLCATIGRGAAMEGTVSSLDLKIRENAGEAVVACSGWLVAGVTGILYDEVKPLMARDRRVVLDLTDL